MFSLSLPKFGFGRTSDQGKIDIPPVQVLNVESEPDKRARRLKHLLKLNHANFAILYKNLDHQNHMPHILGSTYALGCSAEHLDDIYEHESTNEGYEAWKEAPAEIAPHDYRDCLGLRDHQRAWVDFFEDQLVTTGSYDWRNIIEQFLFEEGTEKRPNAVPIAYSLATGMFHALIHLAYAYELGSREVAMEAMGLAAVCYDSRFATLLKTSMAKIKSNTASSLSYSTSTPFEIVARIQADDRLKNLFQYPGSANIERLISDERLNSIVVEHWSAWKVTDPKKQFEDFQKLIVAILMSTGSDQSGHGYDCFFADILAASHALRILLPIIEAKWHVFLLREMFLMTIMLYITQAKSMVDPNKIAEIDIGEKKWQSAIDLALVGKHKFDARYVKTIRAMKDAAALWGDEDSWYLRAALKFAKDFSGWKDYDTDRM